MNISSIRVMAIILGFLVVNVHASDREKNEGVILHFLDISNIANATIKQYRDEAVRIYPSITQQNVDENFSDVFELGRKNIFNAYKDSLSEFTDEELKELIKFYKSDFGKWYISNFQKFNNQTIENMKNGTKKLNDAYIQRVLELQSP